MLLKNLEIAKVKKESCIYQDGCMKRQTKK